MSTVKQVRNHRDALEDCIQQALTEFTERHEVDISRLDLSTERVMSGDQKISNIEIEVSP